jgi:hypothetical protein
MLSLVYSINVFPRSKCCRFAFSQPFTSLLILRCFVRFPNFSDAFFCQLGGTVRLPKRRSAAQSCVHVVFKRRAPHQVIWIETRPVVAQVSCLMSFRRRAVTVFTKHPVEIFVSPMKPNYAIAYAVLRAAPFPAASFRVNRRFAQNPLVELWSHSAIRLIVGQKGPEALRPRSSFASRS